MAKDIAEQAKSQIPARVDLALLNRVREVARQDRRSLTTTIEILLQTGLDAREGQPVKASPRKR
jgi:hypothetical protein